MNNDYRCQCGRVLMKNLSVSGYLYTEIKCSRCKRVTIIVLDSRSISPLPDVFEDTGTVVVHKQLTEYVTRGSVNSTSK